MRQVSPRPLLANKSYLWPPEGYDLTGVPSCQAAELLQREQIRSPAHALLNITLQPRHLRTLGSSWGS